MNPKVLVAILLIAPIPLYAQAQSLNVPEVGKGEAEKVATIIRSDKIKTRAYCDLQKLAKQIIKANQKKDRKRIDELFRKVGKIEETLGPEYRALIDGIQEIAEKDELRAEFVLAFGGLAKLCTK
jgi:wobble nucleotide-excising tRNase